MFNPFYKKKEIPLQQWALDNPEIDNVPRIAKMLILYSVAFIPINPKMKDEYVKKFYNDSTIIEMAIFLLFHYDFFLFVTQDKKREAKIQKEINFFKQTFEQVSKQINYLELIYDRFNLYGLKVNNNNAWIIDSIDLMSSLIIETQELKQFYIHKDDDFITLGIDPINNSLFQSHIRSYINDIFNKVLDYYKQQNLT